MEWKDPSSETFLADHPTNLCLTKTENLSQKPSRQKKTQNRRSQGSSSSVVEEKIEAKLKFSQWEFEFGFLIKLHSNCSTPWAWVLFTLSSPKVPLSQKEKDWMVCTKSQSQMERWTWNAWQVMILSLKYVYPEGKNLLPVGTRSAFGHYGQHRNEMPCQVRATLPWESLI